MQITEKAKDYLQKKGKKSLRIFVAGAGWGGPQIHVALDEPVYNDQIESIDDIQIAIDPYIVSFMDDAVIDVQKVLWMEQLVVWSSIGSSC